MATRKYRYATRQAAESAVAEAEKDSIVLLWAFRDLMDGKLSWLAPRKAGYRVGMFCHDSAGGPMVVLERRARDDKHGDYQFYDAHEFPRVVAKSLQGATLDSERLALAECADHVKRRLHELTMPPC